MKLSQLREEFRNGISSVKPAKKKQLRMGNLRKWMELKDYVDLTEKEIEYQEASLRLAKTLFEDHETVSLLWDEWLVMNDQIKDDVNVIYHMYRAVSGNAVFTKRIKPK